MNDASGPQKNIPLWMALSPIIVLITLLVINVRIYTDDASYGPNQIALLLAAATAAIFGIALGTTFKESLRGVINALTASMTAMILLLLIGSLTGTWMISGIVPAMIYYGLDLLNPQIFLFASVVICAIVSLGTGSSWSTIATVGVALLGIGEALGISLPMAAGAIISGAYFGDKLSPLSDTTNLAAAMAETELFGHIKYMLWTTVPSILITLGIFLAIGFSADVSGAEASNTEVLKSAIAAKFYITPWLFLAPATVLLLVILRFDAISALFIGVIIGGVFAVAFQPDVVREVAALPAVETAPESSWQKSLLYAKESYTAVINAMASPTALTSDNPAAEKLLTGKGMEGMLNTIWLIITAMCFGGIMEACGFLRRITEPLVRLAKSDGSLVATTAGSCFFVNTTASDQYLSIVVPGRMFRESFEERGLDARNLSRTLEDAGTVTSVLVPWNTCGAAQMGVLGVAVTAFAPYCFFNIISPFMTMFYAFVGLKILRTKTGADDGVGETPESDE